MYRVIITGSRDWTDEGPIRGELQRIRSFTRGESDVLVRHGACQGADLIAEKIILEGDRYHDGSRVNWFWEIERFPADWKRYGPAAGPLRNQAMVAYGADLCLAFPLPGSKGTWDCINKAVAAGIRTIIVPGVVRG